jgi:hypothetical protein
MIMFGWFRRKKRKQEAISLQAQNWTREIVFCTWCHIAINSSAKYCPECGIYQKALPETDKVKVSQPNPIEKITTPTSRMTPTEQLQKFTLPEERPVRAYNRIVKGRTKK